MSAPESTRESTVADTAVRAAAGTALVVDVARAAQPGAAAGLPRLLAASVASRTTAGDPTVWGPEAREEAAIRLGWTRLPETSRPLLAQIAALRAELAAEGIDRVVLCGMGGSSLAPEVICAAAGVRLVTLDATDPGQVRAALTTKLARTVVVVSSKSGTTVETDSQRRAFVAAFEAAGIDAASRLVVVTDPGSQLETIAREGGYRAVFLADPSVGGRYSALTAFGLVPSGLAGADVARLLDEAAAAAGALAADTPGNPGLLLGAALAASPAAPAADPPAADPTDAGSGGTGSGSTGSGSTGSGSTGSGSTEVRDKLVLVEMDEGLPGLGDWIEQLVAESTGKHGTGVLPVVVASDAPEVRSPAGDTVVAGVRTQVDLPPGASGTDIIVSGPLGAQLLAWEYATAAAGFLLGINPFDQPDVESAKRAARGLLDATPEPPRPAFHDRGVAVSATAGLLPAETSTLAQALTALLDTLGPRGYLAIMAYLDRLAHGELAAVRAPLAARTGRPVTFGWGPRFLHSTGQYHKGGPTVGGYLQVVGELGEDLAIPGRPFGFARLLAAQAAGDASVLAGLGRPVLTLRVSDLSGLTVVAAVLSAAAENTSPRALDTNPGILPTDDIESETAEGAS